MKALGGLTNVKHNGRDDDFPDKAKYLLKGTFTLVRRSNAEVNFDIGSSFYVPHGFFTTLAIMFLHNV